jgi:NAD+ kinase
MKVGLVVHDGRADVTDFARRFLDEADTRSVQVVADERITRFLDTDRLGEGAPDVIVAIGGDGTMLAAVQEALAHDVPVLGFNLGTIGFLTEAEPADLSSVVAALAASEYTTVPRMGVKATLGDTTACGLNDVVVEKIDSLRLVHLEVEIDGEPFITYRADGLIVATPTGSTAYNFSAGGPLVDHSIEALLLTPVASHSLFARTMVLAPDAEIRVTVRRERPVRASVDKVGLGQTGDGGVVVIRRTPDPIRFVRLDHRSFPSSVTRKFRLETE